MTDDVVRFRIGSKVYTSEALDNVSLRDLMVFNTQVADMGLSYTWTDIERISAEMAAQDKKDAEAHPDAMIMVGVTIWAARRAAGDKVTFEEAVDVPMSKIVWLELPKDHQAPKKKKAAASRSRSSARRAVSEPVTDTSTTPPTSEEPSESA